MNSTMNCPKCGNQIASNALYCQHCGTRISKEAAINQATDPYLGTTIDNTFVVESILGNGSMGVVYKARHRALDRYVAIKILKKDYLNNRVVLTRFQREAQAASGVQHPNIIRILHYGKTALNAPYIAMECLEGEDLSDIIVREFPFRQHRVANILLQVSRALEAAHDAKIIHRDLKPANIKVVPQADGSDLVKVLDFGIAKITDDSGEGLTREGAICGTPAFMSPEQILGQQVTPASDLFSLGSILYFMLTCKLPFQGDNMVDMAASILRTDLKTPSQVRLDSYVDPELDRICMKLLEREVQNRYHDAHELEADILSVLPNLTEADSPNARRRNVVVAAESGVVVSKGETCCAVPTFDRIFAAQQQQDEGQQDPSTSQENLVYENRIPNSDECTVIDQRAYMDDEEDEATHIAMSACQDDSDLVSFKSPGVDAGGVASSSVRAMGPMPPNEGCKSFVNSVPATGVAAYHNNAGLRPGNVTQASSHVVSQAVRGEGTGITNVADERRRKYLFLLIIGAVAFVCIAGIVIAFVVTGGSGSQKEKPGIAVAPTKDVESPASGDGTDETVKEAQPDSDEARLTQLELSFLVGLAAGTAERSLVWTTGYGIVYDSESGVLETEEAKVDAPKEPEIVVQKNDSEKKGTSSKRSSSKEKSSSSKSKSGKSSSTGSALNQKLAKAKKMDESGNSRQACDLYRQIVNDPGLSSKDKLMVQGRLRRCARIL